MMYLLAVLSINNLLINADRVFSGESETIEELLKMSWTFINDRCVNVSAATRTMYIV